jgi:uncharacterized protein Smg (DUF494 family)
MTTDLIDILLKIVEGINNNQSVDKILENINKSRKVNKNIIAAIYSWIFEKISRDIADNESSASGSSVGMRILSEEEKDILGVDNYNYILHLSNLGLLNNSDIENILDQALNYSEGELDQDQLNLMVLSIFLEGNSNLPPGSRLLLYSSDTIN